MRQENHGDRRWQPRAYPVIRGKHNARVDQKCDAIAWSFPIAVGPSIQLRGIPAQPCVELARWCVVGRRPYRAIMHPKCIIAQCTLCVRPHANHGVGRGYAPRIRVPDLARRIYHRTSVCQRRGWAATSGPRGSRAARNRHPAWFAGRHGRSRPWSISASRASAVASSRAVSAGGSGILSEDRPLAASRSTHGWATSSS